MPFSSTVAIKSVDNNHISGQITVETAGTEVQGPDVVNANGFYIKAHTSNTGVAWVGNDGEGAVSSDTGFPLRAGETIPASVWNLNQLYFDADVSGEKFCWIKA